MRKNAQCGLTGGVPDFRNQSARARTRGNPQIIVFPRKSLSCLHGVRMEFKSKKD